MNGVSTKANVSRTKGMRNEATILLVLFALVTLSWLPRLGGPMDLRWDGGVYYILGTSLAEGKGYRLLNEPGEIEAVQYPPLLPLIVAAHQRVLGTSDLLVVGKWLRFFYFLLFAGFTVAAYSLARLYLSRGSALLAACVGAFSLYTYIFSDMLYTELPFALVTVVFVILNRKSERVGYAISTAVLGMAAYLLRTAGIALLIAWVAESLLRGRFRQMTIRAVVALIPVLLWQTYIAGVKESEQYGKPVYAYQRAPYQYSNVTYVENTQLINPFIPELGRLTAADMFGRILLNLTTMSTALGEAVSAPIGYWRLPIEWINRRIGSKVLPLWPVFIPMVVLQCLVIAGMALLATRGEWFVPLYFAASVGLICLTPWAEQSVRYLTPLTPFLALSLFCALAFTREWFLGWRLGRWKKAGSAIGVLVLTMIFLVEGFSLAVTYGRQRFPVRYYDARGKEKVHPLFFYGPPWQALDASLDWLRQRANPGDVIATTVPHWAYLRTRRKAVLPPMVVDGERAQVLLDSVPVRYVVVDDLDYPEISQRYAAPAVETHPDLWRRVYVVPGGQVRVYERIR